MHLYFEITNKCNLNCDYCYNNSSINNINNELTTDEIKKAILKLKDQHALSTITFSGGEPFLRNDLLELIVFCFHNKISPNVITNGTLLKKINKEDYAFFNHLTISLHQGMNTQIDFSYIKSIKELTKIKFNVVLNKNNANCLNEYLDISHKYKIPIYFLKQKESGRAQNHINLSFDEIIKLDYKIKSFNEKHTIQCTGLIDSNEHEKIGCLYLYNKLADLYMLTDGTIALCPQFDNKYVLGNVFDSFHSNKKMIINEICMQYEEYQKKYCSNCIMRKTCKYICPAEVINAKGQKSTMCVIKCLKNCE